MDTRSAIFEAGIVAAIAHFHDVTGGAPWPGSSSALERAARVLTLLSDVET